MGELEPQYEGRVDFNIISAEETKLRSEEINSYGFQKELHGLVGFDAAGNVVVKLPGHNYGKAEIEVAVATVLAGEG